MTRLMRRALKRWRKAKKAPTYMLQLFARREPTNDAVAIQHCPPEQLATLRDVRLYADRECTILRAIVPWHYYRSKPTLRNRFYTLNCFRYALVWLEDKGGSDVTGSN